MAALERKVVLVTRRTRLEELLLRFVTLEQARFYVEHLGADFHDYETEHASYRAAVASVKARLERHGRYQLVDRGLLPNFLFGPDDLVMALGQDGLVANTLKYLDGQPLIGVNPDPKRYDGLLLPFGVADVDPLLPEALANRRPLKAVTMAVASLQDGQRLFAVNDLFIGPRSHTSARYELQHEARHAVQSSSGIIVSTGLGSTGWMRSVLAGAMAIAGGLRDAPPPPEQGPMPWDSERLLFAVREPFPSRTTQVDPAWGYVTHEHRLTLRSRMAEGGVIFSDGIEADYLAFNAGTKAEIAVADRQGRLVA
jgi:NAD kinase